MPNFNKVKQHRMKIDHDQNDYALSGPFDPTVESTFDSTFGSAFDPETPDPRPGAVEANENELAKLLEDEGYTVVQGANNVKRVLAAVADTNSDTDPDVDLDTDLDTDPDLRFSTPIQEPPEEDEDSLGMPKEINIELGDEIEDDTEDDTEEDNTNNTDDGRTIPSTALEIVDAVTNKSTNKLADVLEVQTDEKGRRLFLGTDGVKHPETQRAAIAFEDYVKLGPSRTLKKLAEVYAGEHKEDWSYSTSVQYIHRKLAEYSTNLDWQNRLQKIESRQTAIVLSHARRTAARRKQIRLRYFQMLMRAGARIIKQSGILDPQEASLLSQEEALKHFKDAIKMIDVGAQGEKLEMSEALEKIAPPKKFEDMTDSELKEYMDVLRTEMQ